MNAYTYRGYQYDKDTGFYYLQSRYYDPEVGRFLNADDTNYLGVTGTTLGYNLYAYCENNVVNATDVYGNSPRWQHLLNGMYYVGKAIETILKFRVYRSAIYYGGVVVAKYTTAAFYNMVAMQTSAALITPAIALQRYAVVVALLAAIYCIVVETIIYRSFVKSNVDQAIYEFKQVIFHNHR